MERIILEMANGKVKSANTVRFTEHKAPPDSLFPNFFRNPQEIFSQNTPYYLFIIAFFIQEFSKLRKLLRLNECQGILNFIWRKYIRMTFNVVSEFLFINDII